MAFLSRRWALSVLCVAAFGSAYAAEPAKSAVYSDAPPVLDAADIERIEVHPKGVKLKGVDDAAQLVVTAVRKDGKLQDATTSATYTVTDAKTAKVGKDGRVVPQADGKTKVSIKVAGKEIELPVECESLGVNLPINFANQVVPVFTKVGCNSGGCHGKLAGQNGFRLSLLGFEPDLDYMTLVKEARGRRVMPAAPDASLLLQKATGAVAHGGGKKLEPNSDEYKLLRRWIAAGMPYGMPTDPVVTKITVVPEHRVMTRQNRQQFSVYAHYNDGGVEDITRRAQYESNDQEIAVVEPNGLVRTLALSGEAAIMARYQGFVSTFRATVPLGLKTPDYKFVKQTMVDDLTSKKWKELGLVPSDVCTDEQYIRRLSLDLTGTLPTPEQLAKFIADKDEKKREKLVDELLDTPEYAYFFANKWADILRVKRGRDNGGARAAGTFSFHAWIRDAIANDKPYDQMVADILGASGDESKNPPVVWYKDLKQPEQFVDDTAQVFLGLRMACANCHHHPYEKWSQDDYWSFAAFFGRVGKKNVAVPGRDQNSNTEVVFNRPGGSVMNKRTNQTAPMKPLDGAVVALANDEDPRHKLVDWMIDPKNPFFAKAVANRYWAHFMGRGIVDPIDDMRVTNPPSNPELLDALAKSLVEAKFSLKELTRIICKSRTYQLSSIPNEFNKNDKQAYARYYPRRLSAEVLMDAVNQVASAPAQFGGLPTDKYAPNRAIMLPDESFQSYFLDVFGRPQRISACECERVSEANLAQALHLLNSDELQNKIGRPGGRVDLLIKDMRDDKEKIEEIFLWTLGRKPQEKDLAAALEHIAKHEKNKKPAYENILWALINTKEFIFNW